MFSARAASALPRFLSLPALLAGLLCAGLLPQASAQGQGFGYEQLTALARETAQKPYAAASSALPADLAALDYDGVRDIRYEPARALWRSAQLPFEAMFFHLGTYQTQPVRINEITPQGVRSLPYDAAEYNFGKNRLQTSAWGDLGHAGFRVHYPLNSQAYKDELVVFQGASYFRALGAGQQYGLSARGLAIDTAGGSGEEFPRFTTFWLERPTADAKQLTVYALLDSPRATGAYRFDIRPGAETVTRVQGRVFLREGQRPIATLGIAPLTSMFFFGENQPRAGDFRPEVHDSDGLAIATGDGEWLWRPLQNPARPIVNTFSVTNPRGFGLMQRDRAFANYEDVEARYERRPSAWVKPVGDWGPGRVELVQLPTPDETHDNIVAYWVPATLPTPGMPLDFTYEIAWQGNESQRPPNGWVTQSRRGAGYTKTPVAGEVQYIVDFAGPALDALPADAPVQAIVTASANARVAPPVAYRNPATNTWRMNVRVQRIDPAQPVELRAFLQNDKHILSETWSNIILPD